MAFKPPFPGAGNPFGSPVPGGKPNPFAKPGKGKPVKKKAAKPTKKGKK